MFMIRVKIPPIKILMVKKAKEPKSPKEKKPKKTTPKTIEKNEFKTQANFTLRELEAESSTLKVYKAKIQHQLHFLNIEEIMLRKHLEIWEANKNLPISEIKKKIVEETNKLKQMDEKKDKPTEKSEPQVSTEVTETKEISQKNSQPEVIQIDDETLKK